MPSIREFAKMCIRDRLLDGSKVGEVHPLDGLLRVGSRVGNVETIGLGHHLEPVSYTHLEVYKRQPYGMMSPTQIPSGW